MSSSNHWSNCRLAALPIALALAACGGRAKPSHATPAPAPSPPCTAAAGVLAEYQPSFPEAARDVGEASVTVAVTIARTGRILRTRIERSSGNAALDDAALIAADLSTYTPARRNCMPVGGTYDFKVTYSSSSR